MPEKKKNCPAKQGVSKTKPHFIIVRKYEGKQSMQAAFEQVIEKKLCGQFEQRFHLKSYWKYLGDMVQ